MPPILSKPSKAASTSIYYITIGALLTVWSVIWYTYLRNNPPAQQFLLYLCYGFLGTGLVLLAIGFALGPLARHARNAELPPAQVTPEAPKIPQNTTATTTPNRV
jgi:hypothetical protein